MLANRPLTNSEAQAGQSRGGYWAVLHSPAPELLVAQGTPSLPTAPECEMSRREGQAGLHPA